MRTIYNKEFTKDVEINDSYEDTVYDNCIFKNNVYINNIKSERKFEFKNCQIDGSFYTGSINQKYCFTKISLLFSRSKINVLCVGNRSVQEYDFNINISDANINKCEVTNCVCSKCYIIDSKIHELKLNSCMGKNYDGNISLQHTEIDGLYLYRICHYDKLNIEKSILKFLCILESSIISETNIRDITNYGKTQLYFFNSGVLCIYGSEFEKEFECKYKKLDNFSSSIKIEDCKFNGKASFFNCNLNDLSILCSYHMKGEISFINFNILGTLTLSGFNKGADLKFINIKVCMFSCMQFLNYGTVSILNLSCNKRKDSAFFMCGPNNVGVMIIQGSDLSSFPKIVFLDCSLFGLKYSDIIWFDPQIVNDDYSDWNRKKEAYRQLKYCAEDNKDRIQALIFKSYELDAYRHTLKFDYKNAFDYIMLWLNKYSNNNGLSWVRGVIFTVISCIVFYFIFYICHSDDFSFKYFFWENLIKYLWLPNGIDDLISFLKSKPNFFIGFIGLISYILGKILIAYGIFQTISAFRKYVKS